MCLRDRPFCVGQVAHREENLRRQDVGVALAFVEELAPDGFALAGGVDVGVVEEGDACLEGGVHDVRGGVGGEGVTERQPSAEADFADLDAGVAEASVLHGSMVVVGLCRPLNDTSS